MRVAENIRQSLLNKSRGNRWFFDALVCLIWCECKEGNPTKSTTPEDWLDIELPYFGTSKNAIIDEKLNIGFNTPRKVMSLKELNAIQSFIDTHTFTSITDAQRQIAEDLLNDCCADALNVLVSRYNKDPQMMTRKEWESNKKTLLPQLTLDL